MSNNIPFSALGHADLHVDAVYESGTATNLSSDPLSKLIPGIGNQGGFRQAGSTSKVKLVILYSSMDDPDWPDSIDIYNGIFTYYGDNKRPGTELHATRGNALLRWSFSKKDSCAERDLIPPFLIFSRGPRHRDVVFRGLAVPGTAGNAVDDLIAIWRSRNGQRFQNYRAQFTILDVATVKREWLTELMAGKPNRSFAPKPWLNWIHGNHYEPLTSLPTINYRTKEQQLPTATRDLELIRLLYGYFRNSPHDFERCAAQLACMMDPNITIDKITRPSADGGRDAIGTYRLGPLTDQIVLDFALEAKCYDLNNGVGVKELSRLISRLRHRQFGIIVTTSHISRQAYDELREDRHPVIVLAAADIVTLLRKASIGTPQALLNWLSSSFPLSLNASLATKESILT